MLNFVDNIYFSNLFSELNQKRFWVWWIRSIVRRANKHILLDILSLTWNDIAWHLEEKIACTMYICIY